MTEELQSSPSLLDRSHLYLDQFFAGKESPEKFRQHLVFESLSHHVATNRAFAEYAQRTAGNELSSPSILQSRAAPLLPSALFKRPDLNLLSVDASAVVKRC